MFKRNTLKRGKVRRNQSRGVALVMSLLLLLLLSGMTVAMVISSNSDMLINGYYRGFRGSFYSADSGLTIARQQMINQLMAAGGNKFSATVQPIPSGTETGVVVNVNSTYGTSFQSLNSGQGAYSWPETFKLDTTGTTLTAPTCTVVGGGGTCAAPTGNVTGYQFSNKCDQSSANSDKQGNTTIAPTFQSAVNLGAPTVPLPANDYNQKRAILDGKGSGSTSPSNAEMNASLKNASGTAWPTGGASTGVYLPYSVDPNTGSKTFTGGGIYVKGDASVVLSPSGSAQVYTITQGSTVTTVTVNVSTNSTTISNGSSSQTISGVPDQLDPSTGAVQRDATMLYVDGNITSLKGPGQGQAALSDDTALTITAANNVTITGDILYTSKPVTTTQNQIPNTPADTLIPGSDHGQTLGIFTATGDIQMPNGQSTGNLEIDASIATISQNGTGGLVNTGSAINTLTIVGGRIQNNIKNINTTTRNVFFDRRYAQNNFSPPWFPSTTLSSTGASNAQYVSSVQRLKWLNNTSYY